MFVKRLVPKIGTRYFIVKVSMIIYIPGNLKLLTQSQDLTKQVRQGLTKQVRQGLAKQVRQGLTKQVRLGLTKVLISNTLILWQGCPTPIFYT